MTEWLRLREVGFWTVDSDGSWTTQLVDLDMIELGRRVARHDWSYST